MIRPYLTLFECGFVAVDNQIRQPCRSASAHWRLFTWWHGRSAQQSVLLPMNKWQIIKRSSHWKVQGRIEFISYELDKKFPLCILTNIFLIMFLIFSHVICNAITCLCTTSNCQHFPSSVFFTLLLIGNSAPCSISPHLPGTRWTNAPIPNWEPRSNMQLIGSPRYRVEASKSVLSLPRAGSWTGSSTE